MTVTEKLNFNKRAGELYEAVAGSKQNLESAANYYEIALMICRENQDIDNSLSIEVEILNALTYTLNLSYNYEKALIYSFELHKLNSEINRIHPNTLNSALSCLKLMTKVRRSSLNQVI